MHLQKYVQSKSSCTFHDKEYNLKPIHYSLRQRSLTGGTRSGTYSQNRRFWFITWRGASICNRRSFCSLYGSGLADEETHRPIACKLSHPTWYYSANQVCAFQAVNIATLQCRQMREWEASHTWEDGRKKQTDSDTGRENKGRETEEWHRERERNRGVRRRKLRNRESWETEKVEKQRKLRNRESWETEKVEKQRKLRQRKGEKRRSETEKSKETGVRRRKGKKQEWDGERERNVRNKWRSPKKEKWTAKIEHLIRNGQTHFCSYFPLGVLNLSVSYVQKLWHLLKVPMWNAIVRQNIKLLNKPTPQIWSEITENKWSQNP